MPQARSWQEMYAQVRGFEEPFRSYVDELFGRRVSMADEVADRDA